jgi:hypothetical protein
MVEQQYGEGKHQLEVILNPTRGYVRAGEASDVEVL